MTTPLLTAKLAPPRLGFSPLPRPRLVDVLSRAVDEYPVTLVSGPAGSGKTVLAGQWMRALGRRHVVAWLTLDELDADPAVFWDYLLAALAGAAVDVGAVPGAVPGGPVPPTAGAELAASLRARSRPAALVLDDADRLTDPSAVRALDQLVRHAAGRLRLVLCTRAAPALPLDRYRLAGDLTEVGADQLAFTASETRRLLTRLGAPVSGRAAAALTSTAQGWAVALRLAAEGLRPGATPDELHASLVSSGSGVSSYLSAEVLERQPPAVRRFLLQISVTDELWPELVTRLTGRPTARGTLESLAAANAFVQRAADAPGGYRVHPLVRESLAATLADEAPDSFAAAHQTCARWFLGTGRGQRAVQHAVSAGDWQFAAATLIDSSAVARLLSHGGSARPPTGLPRWAPGPDAAVLRAAEALARGTAPEAVDLATAAVTAVRPDGRTSLRAAAAVVCADAGVENDPPDPVRDAADAAGALVTALSDEHEEARGEFAAVVAAARVAALLRTDIPDEALAGALRTAVTGAETAGAPRVLARCLADLALVEALQGRLRSALLLTGRYGQLCTEHRLPKADRAAAAAALACAWTETERQHPIEAGRWLARARQAGAEAMVAGPLLTVVDNRLRRSRHNPGTDADALGAVLTRHPLPRWVHERVRTEPMRLRFSDGDEQASAELDAALQAATRTAPEPVPGLLVESGVVRGYRLAAAGDVPAAIALLERVLQAAAREEQRRPFLEAPRLLRTLLRDHPELAAAAAWLSPRTGTRPVEGRPAGDPEPQAGPQLDQQLSDREGEILLHLAELRSTREIAAALYVSSNTVRTHIRAILGKLDAHRRSEAVRRARELRLL